MIFGKQVIRYKQQILKKSSLNQDGFTIIELLIVMLILLSVGGLVGSILFISLRSTNKANKTAAVRQNGNAVMNVMSRKIRYATELGQIGKEGDMRDIQNDDPNTAPCSNGSGDPEPFEVLTFYTDNPDPNLDMPILNTFACVDTVEDSDTDTDAIAIGTGTFLSVGDVPVVTDREKTNITSCQFSCILKDSGVATINIKYVMTDENGTAGSDINENVVAPITFSTSVTLRNTQ